MDSEESAALTTINRSKRAMVHANKKRVIEVIQCSGEDMNLVLTNGIPTLPQPAAHLQQLLAQHRPLISPGKTTLSLFLV